MSVRGLKPDYGNVFEFKDWFTSILQPPPCSYEIAELSRAKILMVTQKSHSDDRDLPNLATNCFNVR